MKLEIEVKEEEIKSAIERQVRASIANQSQGYSADNYIKEQVKIEWKNAVDNLIKEILTDLPSMREMVRSSIEAKLRGQLNAAMKATK